MYADGDEYEDDACRRMSNRYVHEVVGTREILTRGGNNECLEYKLERMPDEIQNDESEHLKGVHHGALDDDPDDLEEADPVRDLQARLLR